MRACAMSVIHLLIGNLLMNDFTKEELEFMHKWLNWITEENYPLKNKIQSMIENGFWGAAEQSTHLRIYKPSNTLAHEITIL